MIFAGSIPPHPASHNTSLMSLAKRDGTYIRDKDLDTNDGAERLTCSP